MAASDNKKLIAELKALRDKLNKADGRRDYALVAEACLEIIALDKRAKSLNILAFLYHKDLGEAYVKLQEYQKALDSLTTARDGLLQHRATQKMKFDDEWLRELTGIEKLMRKLETVYLKGY